ncbi:hypothetical protein T459_23255 [Capsicum annuum]|uniref:Thiamine pyrophosphate enzyme central domain-containing protein n=1 Tax=Capsicum annuum TaxID=4072 RepID=A0A2G2YRU7_CAPAN|nr:hypothetical protein FXO37_32724 [Capsicum annuum]PHT72470.1 hypothetical protein T459_23255 [Capsicum annuum]
MILQEKRSSNLMGLEAAVEVAAELLNKEIKPVLVGGQKIWVAKACDDFVELADGCGYAVLLIRSTKGLVLKNHSHFIKTY